MLYATPGGHDAPGQALALHWEPWGAPWQPALRSCLCPAHKMQLQGSRCSPKQDPSLHLGNAKACCSPPPPNPPRPSTQWKILCPEATDG